MIITQPYPTLPDNGNVNVFFKGAGGGVPWGQILEKWKMSLNTLLIEGVMVVI